MGIVYLVAIRCWFLCVLFSFGRGMCFLFMNVSKTHHPKRHCYGLQISVVAIQNSREVIYLIQCLWHVPLCLLGSWDWSTCGACVCSDLLVCVFPRPLCRICLLFLWCFLSAFLDYSFKSKSSPLTFERTANWIPICFLKEWDVTLSPYL